MTDEEFYRILDISSDSPKRKVKKAYNKVYKSIMKDIGDSKEYCCNEIGIRLYNGLNELYEKKCEIETSKSCKRLVKKRR